MRDKLFLRKRYRLSTCDKEVDFLFVTPFSDGSFKEAMAIEKVGKIGKIVLALAFNVERVIKKILENKIKIKNMIFTHMEVDKSFINKLRERGIQVSFCGHGWFPYHTKHFDPNGFAHKSLFANSNFSHLQIDKDVMKKCIKEYKKAYEEQSKKNNLFKIQGPYTVVILQKTRDVTISEGYRDFKSWQQIIDFAHSLLDKKEILIIKAHTDQQQQREKLVTPSNSIIVQSKLFNDDILSNAKLVVGVNSTMLYEASLLYNKPVIALGESWFNGHPEAIKKVKITDTKIKRPIVTKSGIDYRMKMFYIMRNIQTTGNIEGYGYELIYMHNKASRVKKIEDWLL